MAKIVITPQERWLLDDEAHLPMGYCLACHKEVVAHVQMDAAGALSWHCIFCDGALLREDEGLKEVDVKELNTRGYRVVAPEASRLHKEGGASDGGDSGCGSCTTGCSS